MGKIGKGAWKTPTGVFNSAADGRIRRRPTKLSDSPDLLDFELICYIRRRKKEITSGQIYDYFRPVSERCLRTHLVFLERKGLLVSEDKRQKKGRTRIWKLAPGQVSA